MTDPGPPPPELRELLVAERDISAAERIAIRSKLGATMSSAATATGGVLAVKIVVAVVVVAGVWWYLGHAPTRARPDMPAITPAASSEHIDQTAIAPQREPAPPPAPPRRAQPDTPVLADEPAPPAPLPEPVQPPSQADLLAKAWQALARHDAATTLQLLDEDRRLHPEGGLAEEREAMHVQALAAAGRRDDARREADTFFARYPRSVHRAAVTKAVAP